MLSRSPRTNGSRRRLRWPMSWIDTRVSSSRNNSRGWLVILTAAVAIVAYVLSWSSLPVVWYHGVLVLFAALAWTLGTTQNAGGYLLLLGVQLPLDLVALRLALSDLLILPALAKGGVRLVSSRDPRPASTLTAPLLFLGISLLIGLGVGRMHAGHFTSYMLFNKVAGFGFLIMTAWALASYFRDERALTTGLDLFVIGVGVANVVALGGAALAWSGVSNPFLNLSTGRLYGMLMNPSSEGSLLATAGLIELGRIARSRIAWWRWGNLALLVFGIALTQSRSSWLGLSAGAAVLLTIWATQPRPRETRVAAWASGSVAFVAPVAVLAWIALSHASPLDSLRGVSESQRLADLQRQTTIDCARQYDPAWCAGVSRDDLERERSRQAGLRATAPGSQLPTAASEHGDASGALTNARGLEDRAAIVRLAWRMYTASWKTMAFGIGLGTFLQTSAVALGLPLIIHNTPVWLLVELGPLGLAAFLWLIGRTFLNLWATRRLPTLGLLSHGLLAALACWLTFSLFNEASYFRHFWLVLVVADRLFMHSVPVKNGARAR